MSSIFLIKQVLKLQFKFCNRIFCPYYLWSTETNILCPGDLFAIFLYILLFVLEHMSEFQIIRKGGKVVLIMWTNRTTFPAFLIMGNPERWSNTKEKMYGRIANKSSELSHWTKNFNFAVGVSLPRKVTSLHSLNDTIMSKLDI